MAVDLAQKAQNFTNRGRQALESGRYELAVDMLMEAVSAAPDVLETRKLLRAAQVVVSSGAPEKPAENPAAEA